MVSYFPLFYLGEFLLDRTKNKRWKFILVGTECEWNYSTFGKLRDWQPIGKLEKICTITNISIILPPLFTPKDILINTSLKFRLLVSSLIFSDKNFFWQKLRTIRSCNQTGSFFFPLHTSRPAAYCQTPPRNTTKTSHCSSVTTHFCKGKPNFLFSKTEFY